ncbi:MAG: hypothetical protein MJZ66_00940 [Bacteroidales bacterium]|nr:hypothetical protein [Bacteroidales bacterium]
MKRILKTLAAAVMMLTAGINANAQVESDIFEKLSDIMTDDQNQALIKLQEDIAKSEKNVVTADNTDKQYSKLLDSGKKGKQKKGEKKTVEVKKTRIKAAKMFEKSYQAYVDLCKTIVEENDFEFDADKSTAEDYIAQAEEALREGNAKLSTYSKMQDKALETATYKKMKTDLDACKQKYEAAASHANDAVRLLADQADKKQKMDEAEQNDWNKAVQANTIDSYNRYINKYPTGKYVNDARRRIANLQNMAKVKKPTSDDVNEGLCYRIQICADQKPWSSRKLQRLYKGSLQIDERQSDGYYKYWIGCYRTYNEAQTAEQEMRLKESFIVCFNNGLQIHVTEAQEIESKYGE